MIGVAKRARALTALAARSEMGRFIAAVYEAKQVGLYALETVAP
jgi:hypothetical protein